MCRGKEPQSRVSGSEPSLYDKVLTAWTEQSVVKPRTKNQELLKTFPLIHQSTQLPNNLRLRFR